MSAAFDIATYLGTKAFGTLWGSSGWSIQVGQELPSPSTMITVYDTPGREPHYADEIHYPNIQVRVRGEPGSGYPVAMAKIQAIKEDLVFQGTFTANARSYTAWLEGDVHWLMHDEGNRPIFVCNVRLQKE